MWRVLLIFLLKKKDSSKCPWFRGGSAILVACTKFHQRTPSEERVRKAAEKLQKNAKGATQGRIQDFFKTMPSQNAGTKRKAPVPEKADKKKKGGRKPTK